MLSLRTLYLLLSLSLPVPLCAAALGGDDVGETSPDDPVARPVTQPARSPDGPALPPARPAFEPRTADLPPAVPPSSEDAYGPGVIGEYHNSDNDVQDGSEAPVSYPAERRIDTSGSTETAGTPEVATSGGNARPTRGVQSQTAQGQTTETVARDAYGPTPDPSQSGGNPPAFPAEQSETPDGVLAVLRSGSGPTDIPGLDISPTQSAAGPRLLTEHLTPALTTDRWGWANAPSVTTQGEKQEGTGPVEEAGDEVPALTDVLLHMSTGTIETDKDMSPGKEWQDDSYTNATFPLSDCKMDLTATPCNISDKSWSPIYPEDLTSNESLRPSLAISPPLFVPLYSDWNSALATWGLAWEAHIYGLGSVFAVFGLISVICLLGLPLRCPPGSPYFTLLHLLLLAVGGMRAFSLLYDAYSHQDRLPPLGSLLLSELPFPCLTSAFSLAFLLLSLRSRMHLSLPLALSSSFSALPRPCLLFCLSLLHFGVSLGCVGLLQLLHSFPILLLLPQGLFVCLCAILSCSYLLFYCFIRADTRHIYRLNDSGEGGGSPEVTRPASCPFAEAEDWGRAAGAGVGASLCLLGCGGLRLYGILHALGLGGISGFGFQPWPWWGYQLGCRLCEVGVCLGLSLIGTQPLLCHGKSSIRTKTHPRPGSWSRLSCGSPTRGPTLPSPGGEKSPALPPHYPWSLATQEKLVVCEVITKGQSEALPLCPMMDTPRNGVDTAPHPSHTRTSMLPLPTPPKPPHRPKGGVESQLSSLDSLGLDTDSTVDLRPPSPIDLSRSIDQALFSEALFPHSLFDPPRLMHASSSLSLNSPSPGTSQLGHGSIDSALYRTSSCGDVDQERPLSRAGGPLSPHNKPPSSPEQWRWKESNSGSPCQASLSGSSQGLCCSPGETGKARSNPWANKGQQNSLPRAIPHLSHHRRYRTLSLASQNSQGSGRLAGTEDLSESRQLERDLAVQAEFINVCRQIDALSVCSDTIDL